MMKMVSMVFAGSMLVTAAPAFAATAAEVDCAYQADVVEAVRQARIDRVKEREVSAAIKAKAPTWPEKYNAAIPLIAPWVYEMKMGDVKQNDLAAAWKELCLSR